MDRPNGMTYAAWASYLSACYLAKIDPDRVMQTVGTAAASAGTHLADGTLINELGQRESYTGAVDLRTKDLTKAQIERLLDQLFSHGFFAWWRHTGSFAENQHIHACFVRLHLKTSLRQQFHDFVRDLDGLRSHATFDGPTATPSQKAVLRAMFFEHNPVNS